MPWILLALAAAFEVVFALSMKLSEGFTKLLRTAVTAVAVVFGITLLTLAMRTIPVSVAYPIWTAVGTLGTVALGWALLGEAMTPLKAASAALIVLGVAGLKVSTA